MAGGMALLFDLEALIDMMSIGTLMAYTIVAICVMLLRYSSCDTIQRTSEYTLLRNTFADDEEDEFKQSEKPSKSGMVQYSRKAYVSQLLNTEQLTSPTDLTSSIVSYATLLFCLLVTLVALLLVVLKDKLAAGDAGAITGIVITGLLTILSLVVIARQPQSKRELSFKVPLVPWFPALSALFNMYLMCNLSSDTWVRFGIWMALGLVMYVFYGLKNSSGEYRMQDSLPPHLKLHPGNIPTIFESESEDEIYSPLADSDVQPYTL